MAAWKGVIGVFSSSYPITAEAPEAARRAADYLESSGWRVKLGELAGTRDSRQSPFSDSDKEAFMDKTVIIYRSKTGFSRRYAQWLAEDLQCQAVDYRERNRLRLPEYGTIILAGGLYAGQMAGLGWLKKQLPGLAGRRIAALAVGCAPAATPDLPESMDKLFGSTPQIKGFYCQGGLDYEHMGAVDRTMMAALRMMLKAQKNQQEMLDGISRSFDGTKREYLEPAVRWAREA